MRLIRRMGAGLTLFNFRLKDKKMKDDSDISRQINNLIAKSHVAKEKEKQHRYNVQQLAGKYLRLGDTIPFIIFSFDAG